MNDPYLALSTARATRDRMFRLHRVVSLIGLAATGAVFLVFPSVPTGGLALACLGSLCAPWLGRRLAANRASRSASRPASR
jgi:hypothetical protein